MKPEEGTKQQIGIFKCMSGKDRLRIAFITITEESLPSKKWEFGYSANEQFLRFGHVVATKGDLLKVCKIILISGIYFHELSNFVPVYSSDGKLLSLTSQNHNKFLKLPAWHFSCCPWKFRLVCRVFSHLLSSKSMQRFLHGLPPRNALTWRLNGIGVWCLCSHNKGSLRRPARNGCLEVCGTTNFT